MTLKTWSEVKKDALFFTVLGMIFGIIQHFGYNLFDKSQFGGELLQEHIAINSIALILVSMWCLAGLVHWAKEFPGRDYLDSLVTHLSVRAIAFSLVATFVTLGFALATTFFQAYGYFFKFLLIGLYFFALAEVAAHPRIFRKGEQKSALYEPAIGYIVAITVIINYWGL